MWKVLGLILFFSLFSFGQAARQDSVAGRAAPLDSLAKLPPHGPVDFKILPAEKAPLTESAESDAELTVRRAIHAPKKKKKSKA